MQPCAYCDKLCQPTREHVIPRWFISLPPEGETFSARRPLAHVRGDLIVKDVCRGCNGGDLGRLDEYGKSLYDAYFAKPVYWGDQVEFNYDGARLIRWLLKLSYNSARAQNADVSILEQYRDVVLGHRQLDDNVRCWLYLVTPTYMTPEEGLRPAQPGDRGNPNTDEPYWFRIAQFRLAKCPAFGVVQRQVMINSFAFTLLVMPTEAREQIADFHKWTQIFEAANPDATRIHLTNGTSRLSTSERHVAETLLWHTLNYPTRYLDEDNPLIVNTSKGNIDCISVYVPRKLIEDGDINPIAEILHGMVSTREKATALVQRIGIMVDGFDDDPLALWQIPAAKEFFVRLFHECPYIMLLAHEHGDLLKLLAACWTYETGETTDAERTKMAEFLNRAFAGLNTLTHKFALSEELNREVCESATRVLFPSETP